MKKKIIATMMAFTTAFGTFSVPAMASDTISGVVTAEVLNVRSCDSTEDEIIGSLEEGKKIKANAVTDNGWIQIQYQDNTAYVCGDYVDINTDNLEIVETKNSFPWDGPVLNRQAGTVQGPSGKETYYNLDMSGVVNIMRGMGNTDEYWVREDGCKMLGDYIMCAANLNVHPRGSIVDCSLGKAIVCDTGGFAAGNPNQLDIATAW